MSLKYGTKSGTALLKCGQWLEVLDELTIGAFTVGCDHCIIAINYNAQALIGMHSDEVVGHDCREIFTGVPCMSRCVLADSGKAPVMEPDVAVTDENNMTLWITRMATPIYDDNGKLAGCLTILQDHSPISDLIERLHHEESKLKNVLDSLDSGVFTVNRGGLITFFNTAAEQVTGFNRKRLLGRSCALLFEGPRARDLLMLQRTIRDGKSRQSNQGRLMDKEGTVIPVQIRYMALRNEKGVSIGALATFHDLTLVHQLHQAMDNRYTFEDMIGKSPAMQKIFKVVSMVSASDATVLIEGPTGTGKDLLAKVIHASSHRADKPFVKINCAAIPDNLLESEIFGYVKGAFTGADKDKPGRFDEAHGGTIFLDEIGDLPLALQAKLLRVIEDREFYPLGSHRTKKVDVRILSATNRQLQHLVAAHKFRQDLYYRLNVVRIELPPLARRPGDLPLLIRHIMRRICALKGRRIPKVSAAAMKILLNFDYPGNIRELENIIEHALILCTSNTIRPEHLPDYLQAVKGPTLDSPPASKKTNLPSEAEQIARQLNQNGGHRGKTAKALGVNRTTLWRKMKLYRLRYSPANGWHVPKP